MRLSQRALDFLASMDRRAAPSSAVVRERLASAELSVRDAWIDFQERYAGYVERLGNEIAVWGIVHDDSRWFGEFGLDYSIEDDEVFLGCADVHPSFDYQLDGDGVFLGIGGGGPCDSFDKKVEQTALLWAYGESWHYAFNRDPEEIQAAIRKSTLDELASDSRSKWFTSADWVVRESRSGLSAWTRSLRVERR